MTKKEFWKTTSIQAAVIFAMAFFLGGPCGKKAENGNVPDMRNGDPKLEEPGTSPRAQKEITCMDETLPGQRTGSSDAEASGPVHKAPMVRRPAIQNTAWSDRHGSAEL